MMRCGVAKAYEKSTLGVAFPCWPNARCDVAMDAARARETKARREIVLFGDMLFVLITR